LPWHGFAAFYPRRAEKLCFWQAKVAARGSAAGILTLLSWPLAFGGSNAIALGFGVDCAGWSRSLNLGPAPAFCSAGLGRPDFYTA